MTKWLAVCLAALCMMMGGPAPAAPQFVEPTSQAMRPCVPLIDQAAVPAEIAVMIPVAIGIAELWLADQQPGEDVSAGPAVYSGVYRQGFEQSDFYPDEDGGPWWLEFSGGLSDRLQAFRVDGPGRGSYIAVRLTVRGQVAPYDDPGVTVGLRDTRIRVEEILSVEAIPDAQFQARANRE